MAVSDPPAATGTRCRYCRSHVSDQFARVFGDNDDVPHRCTECDTETRLSYGSGAGLDPDIPDPQIAEGRHGGESP